MWRLFDNAHSVANMRISPQKSNTPAKTSAHLEWYFFLLILLSYCVQHLLPLLQFCFLDFGQVLDSSVVLSPFDTIFIASPHSLIIHKSWQRFIHFVFLKVCISHSFREEVHTGPDTHAWGSDSAYGSRFSSSCGFWNRTQIVRQEVRDFVTEPSCWLSIFFSI